MLPLDFILYLQIIIFLFITPGTPRIVIISYSMNYGVGKCVWSALGDVTANLIQATLVIFVIGSFFSENSNILKAFKWIAAIVTFAGAIILIRPENNLFQIKLINIILILGALALGLESILIKILTQKEKPSQILLVNNGIGLIISSFPIFFIWITPNFKQFLALFFIGSLMLCAQICFIQAMKKSEAHFVVPYFYSTLIFVCIYDFLIFHITPDKISIIGGGLIIIGGLVLYLSEIRKKIS